MFSVGYFNKAYINRRMRSILPVSSTGCSSAVPKKGGNWGACPRGKIIWSDIFRDKKSLNVCRPGDFFF